MQDNSVQVVVPNQPRKPRIRRNRNNSNQMAQAQGQVNQQQPSLSEQIKVSSEITKQICQNKENVNKINVPSNFQLMHNKFSQSTFLSIWQPNEVTK